MERNYPPVCWRWQTAPGENKWPRGERRPTGVLNDSDNYLLTEVNIVVGDTALLITARCERVITRCHLHPIPPQRNPGADLKAAARAATRNEKSNGPRPTRGGKIRGIVRHFIPGARARYGHTSYIPSPTVDQQTAVLPASITHYREFNVKRLKSSYRRRAGSENCIST